MHDGRRRGAHHGATGGAGDVGRLSDRRARAAVRDAAVRRGPGGDDALARLTGHGGTSRHVIAERAPAQRIDDLLRQIDAGEDPGGDAAGDRTLLRRGFDGGPGRGHDDREPVLPRYHRVGGWRGARRRRGPRRGGLRPGERGRGELRRRDARRRDARRGGRPADGGRDRVRAAAGGHRAIRTGTALRRTDSRALDRGIHPALVGPGALPGCGAARRRGRVAPRRGRRVGGGRVNFAWRPLPRLEITIRVEAAERTRRHDDQGADEESVREPGIARRGRGRGRVRPRRGRGRIRRPDAPGRSVSPRVLYHSRPPIEPLNVQDSVMLVNEPEGEARDFA